MDETRFAVDIRILVAQYRASQAFSACVEGISIVDTGTVRCHSERIVDFRGRFFRRITYIKEANKLDSSIS